jgi:Ni,Fe-hydrogenase III small subunit/formate hydrogenlyase subunit 6/NADH:ubiquinone oxidoreductase subunit I
MFEVLRKSLSAGIVTTAYPAMPPELSSQARGRPEIDWPNWRDARPSAAICPTGAISYEDAAQERVARLDLAKCIFCGLCAEVDQAIRMTQACECACANRIELIESATYQLKPDGSHDCLASPASVLAAARDSTEPSGGAAHRRLAPASDADAPTSGMRTLGDELGRRIQKLFGRSLHIREVDAGSCNGCEVEIVGLNSPIYDLERFGIHFVASPRHADLLLVTGPVTRNMELALRKTYEAMPDPRLVVAVGACGCSGGIFGVNYATVGGVDAVIPVDVYVPGCPPNPYALLDGILLAVGRRRRP